MKHLSKYSILIALIFPLFKMNGQNIRIKAQNLQGTVSNIYKPGVFLVPKTTNGSNDFLNNGIRHNTIRLISIETALNDGGPSIAGVMAVLEAQKASIFLANSRCDKLVLPILKMPLWLSSSSDTTTVGYPWRMFNAVPPASYSVWNLLMDSIVNKINVQWGLKPYYEIWNEPDGYYWQGTPNQYFTFFKNTYFAIKSNHPSALVGGPTVSGFTSKFGSIFPAGYLTNAQLDSTIIGTVIDSCVKWNASLDFICWHKFEPNLNGIKMEINYLNQKLVSSGHGTVPYIVSEWNTSPNLRDKPFATAYMANYVLGLEEYGIESQLVASWQDFDMGTTEFHSDYGLLSWGALHKPAWKSLLLLNKLRGTKIQSTNSDYRSLAISSSITSDTLKVLVSNYSGPGNLFATSDFLYNKQFSIIDLINAGFTSSKLDSVYKGLIILTGTSPLTLAINAAIPIYQKADSAFLYGRNINLIISGLTGTHIGTKYLIDSIHNNIIYRFDSLLTAGHTRASATTFLYPNSIITTSNISVSDSIYSFHMQPNAVVLFEFLIPGLSGIKINYKDQNDFTIYPIPSSESVTVKLTTQPLNNQQINIYNSVGTLVKVVLTKHQSTVINISELPPGLYFMRQNNYLHQTQKFIKQ